ncbi:MAG: ABC transporter substrate-binding protein [Nitriliruptoraceae bacterium]
MHYSWIRRAVVLAVASALLAACSSSQTPPPSGSDAPPSEAGDAGGDAPPFVYEVGMFADIAAENWWAYLDDADGWSGFVLDGSACQLYELTPPTSVVTPQLAAHDWPQPERDGDVWAVEVDLAGDATWSDGTSVTAADMVFTWQTVNGLELGGQWLSFYEPAAREAGLVTAIEALDETSVRIEFADEPGLGTWPMAVALAPIMPEHHWGPIVDGAADVSELLTTSGAGSPVCGPYEFVEREPGAFVRVVANEDWFLAGTSYTHYADGTVAVRNDARSIDERYGASSGDGADEVVAEYVTGPNADEVLYTLYSDAAVAVGALVDGEIAFLLTGPGLDPAAQDRLFDAEGVEVVANPNYTLQFLGFNLERAPMNDLAFREAVATVIDREHIAQTVMGGAALPLYTRMPSGNTAWFDDAVAEDITSRWRDFPNYGARLERAVEILRDAGYTWEVEPTVNGETGDLSQRGAGLTAPDGTPVADLELLHPTAGYDALRNTAGLFTAQFIGDLGVDVAATPLPFGELVSRVIDPSNLQYDMAILGWGLGNPALPTYYDMFWRSDAPLNIVGYASDEYDDAVARFMQTRDLAAAYDILWNELEPILDADLPYVPLFDTPVVEGYRPEEITFPYTEVLGGLGNQGGLRALVLAPE